MKEKIYKKLDTFLSFIIHVIFEKQYNWLVLFGFAMWADNHHDWGIAVILIGLCFNFPNKYTQTISIDYFDKDGEKIDVPEETLEDYIVEKMTDEMTPNEIDMLCRRLICKSKVEVEERRRWEDPLDQGKNRCTCRQGFDGVYRCTCGWKDKYEKER